VAVVLDSDAVVGFLDRDDGLHDAADAAIRDLVGEHRLLVSAVTYAEVLTGARLGHHDEAAVGGFFTELISAILAVDVAVVDRAADLRSRFRSLRMPDALILASADTEASVEFIVTGDQQMAKVSGLSCTVRLLG
jgi:predicted nucleic acid-binding protein